MARDPLRLLRTLSYAKQIGDSHSFALSQLSGLRARLRALQIQCDSAPPELLPKVHARIVSVAGRLAAMQTKADKMGVVA